jgi:hypothetical protein
MTGIDMTVSGRSRATRLQRTLLAGAVIAMVAAACGAISSDRPTETLSWDLSRGHTTEDVRWPGEGNAFELGPGVQVSLTLPGGRTFAGSVDKVLARREGDTIRNLDLFFPAMSTDEAYDLAKQLGARWDVNLRNIDAWYERRVAQRDGGREDVSDTAFTGSPDSAPLGGEGGPVPAIEMLNSFDGERPVVVNLSFLWPR